MSPWAARTRGPGHTVRFRYLEWKIQSVNLEVLQYVYTRIPAPTLKNTHSLTLQRSVGPRPRVRAIR